MIDHDVSFELLDLLRQSQKILLLEFVWLNIRHHPDCYLTTDSNAAAVASDVDANKLEGFSTLKVSCFFQLSVTWFSLLATIRGMNQE